MAGRPKTRARKQMTEPQRIKEWQDRYVDHLSQWGLHYLAARYARISSRHVREVRERDKEFDQRCIEAEEHSIDIAEKELRRRAIKGVEKPVFQGGEEVGAIREYSDSNLQFMLRGRRRGTFGDSTKIEADVKLSRESDLDDALDAILGHRPGGVSQGLSGREAGDPLADTGEA